MRSAQINHQPRALTGSVAILWDIENCPVPSDVRPEDVAGNIRMALQVHPLIEGAVTLFSAYGDFNAFPRRLREGCQRTGIKLVDVPNGRKDAADKAILIDMFLFALDNHPPSSILLISGDVDFAPALHVLGQRGYTIILVIPSGKGVSSALVNAGRFVWDWPSVAHGEGFVPPKAFMHRGPESTGYLVNYQIGDNSDAQNDEEAIVYNGISWNEFSTPSNFENICSFNFSHVLREISKTSYSLAECENKLMGLCCYTAPGSQSLPSSLNEVSMTGVAGDSNELQEQILLVQPGDIQGLKGQLVKLLEMFGGSLPLVRVPAEYQKMFGRQLFVADYGESKLVNIFKKMPDKLTVEKKGNEKFICLCNAIHRPSRVDPSTPVSTSSKNKKGVQEENVGAIKTVGSLDEFSDDEKVIAQDVRNITPNPDPHAFEFNEHFTLFRQELQELLVSYSCKILLSHFKALYEQRYKKTLDYHSFGVKRLEDLIDKLRGDVLVQEEQGSARKFLVANCASGSLT